MALKDARLLCILAATYFPGRFPREYRRRAWVSRPCSGWERVGHQHYDHQKVVRGAEGALWATLPLKIFIGFVGFGEGRPPLRAGVSSPSLHE
jgi:hypothetical protein